MWVPAYSTTSDSIAPLVPFPIFIPLNLSNPKVKADKAILIAFYLP